MNVSLFSPVNLSSRKALFHFNKYRTNNLAALARKAHRSATALLVHFAAAFGGIGRGCCAYPQQSRIRQRQSIAGCAGTAAQLSRATNERRAASAADRAISYRLHRK